MCIRDSGYSIWWPKGKEFDNDKYAECVQAIRQQPTKVVKDVSLRHKVAMR